MTGIIDLGVDLGDYAGFVPGLVVSIPLGVVLCGRVARGLGVGRAFACLLLVSLGVILSATVTPSREALLNGVAGTGSCDLSRIGPAQWSEYLALDDVSLNVLLFVPLGACLGLLPPSRYVPLLVAAAIVLPFAIEATQLVAVPLDRACQSADVFDNLAGLFLGLGAGLAVARIRRRARPAATGSGGER